MNHTVDQLARLVKGQVIGDGSCSIEETRSLEQAAPNSITFAVGDYVEFISQSKAGAVIVEAPVEGLAIPQIVVANAKAAFAQVLECFHPPVTWEAGIHETAIIGKNVSLGENVAIGPYVVINDNAVIGDNVIIRPYVYIGHNVRI